MITPDGWLDWATRVPGPADKVYSATNNAIGYVPHSAVGFYSGWAARLFSTDRRPDGRYTPYAAASVHGWIAYDGSVTQHYPFTASCWASGSEYPNTNFIAFENEGGYNPEDEPFTAAQIATNARIIRELAAWKGWARISRPADDSDGSATLYEHNECVRFGSVPTSCPSRRAPWEGILAALGQPMPASSPQPAPPAPTPPAPDPGKVVPTTSSRTVIVHLDTGSDVVMDIDEYARGVLPYEMATGWPIEALKAQAIAAKSYAIASGAVYTDTRSQVYGPLRYADTDAAVQAVKGMYLAYQGQVIMPFYFGHCGGQTRSPSAAGWSSASDRPYLQGVTCICDCDGYFGHGIGMCQRGAQKMALAGATFDQILRHYYSGIDILGFTPGAQPAPPPANAQTCVVQRGDTLQAIAARFGLDWPAIFTANRAAIADPNVLTPGTVLVIPRAPTESGEPDTYVIQPGDTLFSLARRWSCTVAAIVGTNSIENESLIRVGQRLRIPRE